jgi:hypothetical protein
MIVRVEQSMRATAEEWSRRIFATGLNNRRNYSGFEKPERYIIGYIGELAFKDKLTERGKRFEFRPRLDGHSDRTGYDFIVWSYGMPLTINVKTAGESFHKLLSIPVCMFNRYRADIYVAGHLCDNNCHMRGWVYHYEIKSVAPLPPLLQSRSIPFDDLRDIEQLFNMLDDT